MDVLQKKNEKHHFIIKRSVNHQDKEYLIMRGVVIWLYDYKCGLCQKKPKKIEVHHINKNSSDNRIENLMPLCKPCHKLAHKMNIFQQISINKIILLMHLKIILLKNPTLLV